MKSRLIKLAFFCAALAIVILVTGFVWWPRSLVDIAHSDPKSSAELIKRWQAGDVVVLIRHAERCDRSSNPCSGPSDGITDAGSHAAVVLGQHFKQLGMGQTDVLSSPVTRTGQTSRYMFGKDATAQDWLASCGKNLRNDVVAHKNIHHNLLLVTHSGCISDFETQVGYAHAATSEYGSSLFVRIDPNGDLEVLGILNADDWPVFLRKQSQFK
ncbi:MAG: phosphoglycerate mutase [Pseudomonas sp.]|nr:phosphoglycerate mutase [Pseudomonas sp.]